MKPSPVFLLLTASRKACLLASALVAAFAVSPALARHSRLICIANGGGAIRCLGMRTRTAFLIVAALVAAFTFSLQAQPLVTIETVTVGDAGNAADSTGYGAVANVFAIGKYEVTIGQYATFLNAVDPGGTNPNGIYYSLMGTNLNSAGISFTAAAAVGSKYSVMNNGGSSSNRPITFVNWFDAARFAN